MSNTNMCCKNCRSDALYEAKVFAGGEPLSLLPVGTLHGPRYRIIVCSSCGYTEWYVQAEHLHLVKEKLAPVTKTQVP